MTDLPPSRAAGRLSAAWSLTPVSNRAALLTDRQALDALDEKWASIEHALASRNAKCQLARARSMLRATMQLLDQTLQQQVDGIGDGSPAEGACA